MTTPLDRYFEILNRVDDDRSSLQEIPAIFAENVLLLDCGEFVQGRERAVAFLHRKADRRQEARYFWKSSVGEDGVITAHWSEVGQDRAGTEFYACGRATVVPDRHGKISYLNLILAGSSDRARLLTAKHMQVWSIPDRRERALAMEEVYAEDITFMEPEPDRVLVGRDVLNDYIGAARHQAPLVSMEVESFYRNQESAVFRWDAVLPDDSTAVGWEFLYTTSDLIERVVVFGPDHEAMTEGPR
ncbi:hypothetical protein [Streptomyces cadmiisoli]|uniref:hypothetical protein n=1 Tax=Streptomyces cadmiisoli TaxID=2184053 RepID=UPI00364D8B76